MSLGLRTIAFPAISCGAFGFPIDEAAKISVNTIRESLSGDTGIESVTLVAMEADVFDAWQRNLQESDQ